MIRTLTKDERISHMMNEYKQWSIVNNVSIYGMCKNFIEDQIKAEEETKRQQLKFNEGASKDEISIDEKDLPAFEICYKKGTFTYKIWADGRTENFSQDVIIVNRIPQLIAAAVAVEKAKAIDEPKPMTFGMVERGLLARIVILEGQLSRLEGNFTIYAALHK
jgi:hypothetical protein